MLLMEVVSFTGFCEVLICLPWCCDVYSQKINTIQLKSAHALIKQNRNASENTHEPNSRNPSIFQNPAPDTYQFAGNSRVLQKTT